MQKEESLQNCKEGTSQRLYPWQMGENSIGNLSIVIMGFSKVD